MYTKDKRELYLYLRHTVTYSYDLCSVYYPAEQHERDNQNSTDALTLCIEFSLMTNLRCCFVFLNCIVC